MTTSVMPAFVDVVNCQTTPLMQKLIRKDVIKIENLDQFYDELTVLHKQYNSEINLFELWTELKRHYPKHDFSSFSNDKYIMLLKIFIHDKSLENMHEEWRDIEGYAGLYQVSNLGRVKSCDHISNVTGYNCKKHTFVGRILKLETTRLGYRIAHLCKNGKDDRLFVQRLVAKAFLDNKDNLPCVNHKDETPWNNTVTNLEWCTYSYNNAYNDLNKRRSETKRKHFDEGIVKFGNPICMLDDKYKIIATYDNCEDCQRKIKINPNYSINRRKALTCKNHHWMLIDEYEYVKSHVDEKNFYYFMKFYLTTEHPRIKDNIENHKKIDQLIKEFNDERY